MMDVTSEPGVEYPNLTDEYKKAADAICEDKTAQEICDIGNYLCDKGQTMKSALAKSVKMEDFQKMKNKGMMDDESTEGEE